MPKRLRLVGKVAVVTGASRGLGQRTAVTMAEHGASIALVARSLAGLEETLAMISSRGGRALAFQANLGDVRAVEALRAQIEAQLGQPSILVNAAGIFGPIALMQDSDPQAWLETITINTVAPYLLCRAFVGGMCSLGWGRIVNFTSAASLHQPGPLNSAYGTSKAALNQLTRHLAAELEGTGVTANVIHPGDVKTAMWAEIRDDVARVEGPAGDGYRTWAQWVEATGGDDPQKAADLVLRLMSDRAATINGRFLWIEDGLQAPIPSWGEAVDVPPWR